MVSDSVAEDALRSEIKGTLNQLYVNRDTEGLRAYVQKTSHIDVILHLLDPPFGSDVMQIWAQALLMRPSHELHAVAVSTANYAENLDKLGELTRLEQFWVFATWSFAYRQDQGLPTGMLAHLMGPMNEADRLAAVMLPTFWSASPKTTPFLNEAWSQLSKENRQHMVSEMINKAAVGNQLACLKNWQDCFVEMGMVDLPAANQRALYSAAIHDAGLIIQFLLKEGSCDPMPVIEGFLAGEDHEAADIFLSKYVEGIVLDQIWGQIQEKYDPVDLSRLKLTWQKLGAMQRMDRALNGPSPAKGQVRRSRP